MWFYCYCSNYASNVLLPLSAFLLPFLHESPQGMLMFPRTANTPGDNSELRNLDSTPDWPLRSQEAMRKLIHLVWFQFPHLHNESWARISMISKLSCKSLDFYDSEFGVWVKKGSLSKVK